MNRAIKIINNISSLKAYRPETGELLFCADTNEMYLCDNNKHLTKLNLNQHKLNHHAIPTNCKNCGAVLTSNKCEYCDTEY